MAADYPGSISALVRADLDGSDYNYRNVGAILTRLTQQAGSFRVTLDRALALDERSIVVDASDGIETFLYDISPTTFLVVCAISGVPTDPAYLSVSVYDLGGLTLNVALEDAITVPPVPPAGGGGSELVQAVTGMDAGATGANAYETANGVALGSTAFSAVWFGRLGQVRVSGTQFLFGNAVLFGGGGWGISKDADRFQLVVFDGASSPQQNFSNGVLPGSSGQDFATGSIVHLVLTHDGTTARLYVNGRELIDQGCAGYTGPVATPTKVGSNPTGGFVDFDGAVIGCSYVNTVMTDDEILTNFLACRDSLLLVDNVGFENLWNFNPGAGVAPATISDLGSSGDDLTLTGSLSIEERRPVFLTAGG